MKQQGLLVKNKQINKLFLFLIIFTWNKINEQLKNKSSETKLKHYLANQFKFMRILRSL